MARKRVPVSDALGSNAFFPSAQQTPDDQQASQTADKSTGTPVSPGTSELVKATFYLDRQSAELLDDYWLQQRRTEGLSKSELIRKAIRMLVQQ